VLRQKKTASAEAEAVPPFSPYRPSK